MVSGAYYAEAMLGSIFSLSIFFIQLHNLSQWRNPTYSSKLGRIQKVGQPLLALYGFIGFLLAIADRGIFFPNTLNMNVIFVLIVLWTLPMFVNGIIWASELAFIAVEFFKPTTGKKMPNTVILLLSLVHLAVSITTIQLCISKDTTFYVLILLIYLCVLAFITASVSLVLLIVMRLSAIRSGRRKVEAVTTASNNNESEPVSPRSMKLVINTREKKEKVLKAKLLKTVALHYTTGLIVLSGIIYEFKSTGNNGLLAQTPSNPSVYESNVRMNLLMAVYVILGVDGVIGTWVHRNEDTASAGAQTPQNNVSKDNDSKA